MWITFTPRPSHLLQTSSLSSRSLCSLRLLPADFSLLCYRSPSRSFPRGLLCCDMKCRVPSYQAEWCLTPAQPLLPSPRFPFVFSRAAQSRSSFDYGSWIMKSNHIIASSCTRLSTENHLRSLPCTSIQKSSA